MPGDELLKLVKLIKQNNYPGPHKIRLCIASDGSWTVEEYCYLDGGGMGWELDSWGDNQDALTRYLHSPKYGGN